MHFGIGKMTKHTREQFETALGILWERLEKIHSQEELEQLTKDQPLLEELYEFGINGPIGLGLGNFGGHSV